MRSPSNPSSDDIRAWASDPHAEEPIPDWDLVLSWGPYDTLFIELAGDSHCPQQKYFLRLLYYVVSRSIHLGKTTEIRDLIKKGLVDRPFAVHQWATRSLEVLDYPERFSETTWLSYTETEPCVPANAANAASLNANVRQK